jgi:hypothetical protein
MVGVEQWARLLASSAPPRYERAPAGRSWNPFKDWICEQLRADPRIESQRLRELAGEIGHEGGKPIFDDCVREVRPRSVVARTFQGTIYRPGELVQCDLWKPARADSGRPRSATSRLVVTCEVC